MMSERQYNQIKKNLTFWKMAEREGTNPDAAWELFADCRRALELLIAANEENRPPSLWERLTGAFRG